MVERFDYNGDDFTWIQLEPQEALRYWRFYGDEDHEDRNRLFIREPDGDMLQVTGETAITDDVFGDFVVVPEEYSDYYNQHVASPCTYYNPALDLFGTANELYTQARNGYIESPHALREVESILEGSHEFDDMQEKALHVSFMAEAAENGDERYNLGQMKRDVYDMGHTEEIDLKDGWHMQVTRDGFDHAGNTVSISLWAETDSRRAVGVNVLPLNEFYNINHDDFDAMLDGLALYGMIEQIDEAEHNEQDQYELIDLFGAPVLFENGRIDDRDVPDGLLRYELRGSDDDPGMPVTVENRVAVNCAATVLTAYPLPISEQGYLKLGDGLDFKGEEVSVQDYRGIVAGLSVSNVKQKMQKAIARENDGYGKTERKKNREDYER